MAVSMPPASCKVYTPDELAEAIAKSVGDAPAARWLEPSHGHGSFLRALHTLGVCKERIVAVDLDSRAAESDKLAKTKRGIDFLKWSSRATSRFDCIVGNPPYVAIRRLPSKLQKTAASVLDQDGKPIGIAGNLWHAFVLASLRVLAPGGSLAFVLPSAAEYADYSNALRLAVRNKFDILEVYRCRMPLFDEVQEGTIVAIARGYGSGPCRYRRKEYDNRTELVRALGTGRSVRKSRCPKHSRPSSRTGIPFSDVATVRLGGVTGDAAFFLMTEEQREAAGLPEEACSPVITRCRHIKRSSIDAETWQHLRQQDERIWLFNPPDRLLRRKAVKCRLDLEVSEGGCNREAFKVAARNPWYRTPMPDSPHAFMSGMNSIGPWLTLNEMPSLNATNTLYVVQFAGTLSLQDRYSVALSLLTSVVRKQLTRSVRQYADGLCKYEPGALRDLMIPNFASCQNSMENYPEALTSLLAGDTAGARQIADASFSSAKTTIIC